MYQYSEQDHQLLLERVSQFRGQVQRRLKGELSEDEFKQQRLRNGLYLQLHAYMLRVAIPYGLLSAEQMRTLAHIARKYDKGYGHISTRQNIQYNWPKLEDVPPLFLMIWLRLKCTPFKQVVTAFETLRLIHSQVSHGMRLKTLAPIANLFANGLRSIRNLISFLANSKLQSAAPPTTEPRLLSTILDCVL